MTQIFLQTSKITPTAWANAYSEIESLLTAFPTKILRLNSYYGYEGKYDTLHFDLIVDENLPTERISFWGDWMSYTGSRTVEFYKNFAEQLKQSAVGKEMQPEKSVFWEEHIPYRNDGDVPTANGIMISNSRYFDIEGAHYHAAVIAVGVLLENLFPGAAYLVVWDGGEPEEIEAIMTWLAYHFDRDFEPPIYTDRKRLFAYLRKDYEKDEEIICRMAHLYRTQHKANMEFAITHVGYDAALAFYARVLADTGFGTFGFSDIFNPWIAVTQDLEAALELVSASKELLLQNPDDERRMKEGEKYDFGYILKNLLSNYILWSPVQREALAHFHTNKDALEGKEEDLFGTMRRIMGYRVDISPIYADEQELFESFMYHDPKNGAEYRKIIEDWQAENADAYEKLTEAIEAQRQEFTTENTAEIDTSQTDDLLDKAEAFVADFAPAEQYFVRAAVTSNPVHLDPDTAVAEFKQRIYKVIEQYRDKEYFESAKGLSSDRHKHFIKSRIREIGYKVHPDFEKELKATEDESVLFHLHFCMALKVYDRKSHSARFRLLWEKQYREEWENSEMLS